MLKLILPAEHALQHRAIQDAIVTLIYPLKWTVVADWILVTPGDAEERIYALYSRSNPVFVVGQDGREFDSLRIVVIYVTEEYENDELRATIQEAIREVVGVDLWKRVSVSG